MRFVIGSLLVLGAACGGGIPGSLPTITTTTAAPTTTLDTFSQGFVNSAIRDAERTVLTRNQAECIAVETLEGFSRSRLSELGVRDDGTGGTGFLGADAQLTPRERRFVVNAFELCIDDPYAWLVAAAADADQCLIDQLRVQGITLEQILFSDIDEYSQLVDSALEVAQGICTG